MTGLMLVCASAADYFGMTRDVKRSLAQKEAKAWAYSHGKCQLNHVQDMKCNRRPQWISPEVLMKMQE